MARRDDKTTLLLRLQLTAVGAMAAETVTFPLDFVKTRLQLQGEGTQLAREHKKGAFGMAKHIVRTEGLRGFFKGVEPALLRHLVYTPIRIVSYEQLRIVASADGTGRNLPLWQKLACGFSAGIMGQLIASPADLVKVRMQADGRRVALGGHARYTGVFDAFTKIVQADGVKGLWRGVGPNVQRAGLVNLGELATYDASKQFLLTTGLFVDNIVCHLAASAMSGLVSAGVSTPADVVKTRMMNMETSLYKNSLDCLIKSAKAEGVLALWKGFFPTWARLAPWQLTFWVTYEELRKLAGVSSF